MNQNTMEENPLTNICIPSSSTTVRPRTHISLDALMFDEAGNLINE